MKKTNEYVSYEDYCIRQMSKTQDPSLRQKWLNDEWEQKISGFTQVFSRLGNSLNTNSKILCIGARTGQEVVAFQRIGCNNVIGIDLVECLPNVIKGDMHNLPFDRNTFDIVFSNIFDHSLQPKIFISEIERVLKEDGLCYLQLQVDLTQDEFAEHIIENPFYDILSLFDVSYCHHIKKFDPNFTGMNLEIITRKDADLVKIYQDYGSLATLNVPNEFRELWNDINLPIQENKLNQARIYDSDERQTILDTLSKRAYFLVAHAKQYQTKNIAEVGTAEGWQFYSFCKEQADKGSVWSCDIRDVRHQKYKNLYQSENFVNGTSSNMSDQIVKSHQKIGLFYIDGAHDKGSVINDVITLIPTQEDNSIWIFDDFDHRFGCYEDIVNIAEASQQFKVYSPGKTASGNPTHQVLCKARFQI